MSAPATLRALLREELVQPLEEALGDRLRTVLVFGSAVPYLGAPEVPLLANVNLLVLVDGFDLEVAEALRRVMAPRDNQDWAVTLAAWGELPELARVFPLEVAALRRSRCLLHGSDPLGGVHPREQSLETQVRFEVLSKRQALRNILLQRAPSEPEVGEVLLDMAQAYLPLARGLLRARGIRLEALEEVLAWLQRHAGLGAAGAEALRDLQATREDRRRPASGEKRTILEAWLQAWDCLVDLPRRVAHRGPRPLPLRTRRRLRGLARRGR